MNTNAPSLDIAVLHRCDKKRQGGGIALYVSDKLEFQGAMCGSKELESLLVNNVQLRLHIGLCYWSPANSAVLHGLHSILKCLGTIILSSFVLIGYFNLVFYIPQHPLFVNYLAFYTVLY